MLVLDRVSFAYPRRQPVLASVSFEVGPGEAVSLIGENGAGKSTLLSLLIGTAVPTAGSISVFGRPPGTAQVGMVWQKAYDSLYPWWDAMNNAALPLKLLGWTRRARRQRVEQLAAELNLDFPLSRMPYELSGGELQKLCVVRALVADPSILIMDEPFANLSLEATNDLMVHLQAAQAKRGLTLLIVSHSLEHSVFLSDTVIRLTPKPVTLTGEEKILVDCPYSRPRPLSWTLEPTFRRNIDRIRMGALNP
ncbi:MAG TPA: ATP-binding cassette domain-containing protein [Tepidisphaeraceae bacterium]|nr:ATP-binding cassette domain-containing protein [Tepidisphaeraceae bacterium]